eukprot:gb/GECH01008747.1/.p1 GENE.gb/GECH01008747.1/~~gb/GECH01008747.1/.p1  ORF type:complete len:135 (+),score=26.64 gb/GECH01008747.1/:1-405(+)
MGNTYNPKIGITISDICCDENIPPTRYNISFYFPLNIKKTNITCHVSSSSFTNHSTSSTFFPYRSPSKSISPEYTQIKRSHFLSSTGVKKPRKLSHEKSIKTQNKNLKCAVEKVADLKRKNFPEWICDPFYYMN